MLPFLWLKQNSNLLFNSMYVPDSLILKPSPVHGLGIFAAKDISANVCLGLYQGIEYTLKDFKEKYGNDTRYTYSLGRMNKIISAKEERNWITFINESKTPNVFYAKRGCWTNRLIKKDEELFLTYPKKYPRDYSLTD
jgi:SET domain-containing protein